MARPRRNRRRSRPAEGEATEQAARKQGIRLRVRWELLRARMARYTPVFVWTGRLIVLAAVAAGAVAAGRLLEQHVRTAAAFETTEIEVEGAERLQRDQVVAQAGLSLGQNVFEVSPEEARALLLEHPWVAEATVVRRLPGHYRIELRERTPAAVLVLERPYLVGDDGTVFKPLEHGDPADLPVITGVDPERFRSDLALRKSLLVNAVALLHDYRDVGLWRREPVSEIHVEIGGGFSLYIGAEPTLVRLGDRPFRRKLRRLRGILDELRDQDSRPAYVYLDNVRRPDRVTVRLR
ncbi:MAG: FtsQ-type POTRA domain-containing protein [Myxococcales bacterium]|jgi:cell division protein FtsQ